MIELTVWVLLPPKPAVFASVGEKASKADIDESLQSPKGLTGIGMPKVIGSSANHLIYHGNELLYADRSSPLGKALDLSSDALLGALEGKT